MKRIKKLLKKVNDIVNNIDTNELLERIEIDEEQQQEFEVSFNEMKVYYEDNVQYTVKNKIKYSKYKEYNDYNTEEDIWTSLKAS